MPKYFYYKIMTHYQNQAESSTKKSVCKEPNGYDFVEEILGGMYISGIFPATWGMDYATDPTELIRNQKQQPLVPNQGEGPPGRSENQRGVK